MGKSKEPKPFGPESEDDEKKLVLGKKETPGAKLNSKFEDKATANDKATSTMVKRARKAPWGRPIEGEMAKRRYDRPGRRLGGRVGADVAPLSSAARKLDVVE